MTPTPTARVGISDNGTVYRADSGHTIEQRHAIFGGVIVEVPA